MLLVSNPFAGKTLSTAIVWFRRDLRLADHPALSAALAAHDAVVPVYIHAPEEESPWEPGAASRWWLDRSLERFARRLEGRKSRLVVRRGPSLEALQALRRSIGATAVYWQRAYEPGVAARDARVAAALEADGARVVTCRGALLVEPDAVLSQAGTPYRVFSAYWKAWYARLSVASAMPAPKRIPAPDRWPPGSVLRELELAPGHAWADGLEARWEAGEDAANRRLAAFCDQDLEHYPTARDWPGTDGVSGLSPYLHFGELSPRQLWHAVQAIGEGGGAAGRTGAESFLRQLAWREFAAYVLHHWPDTDRRSMDRRFDRFPWRTGYGDLLRRWQQGRTGYPMVDAGMRELWHTGWMHNRARMLAASFLVKNCRVPWQEGARWFWDTLVDADLANNSLGWQWVAGTGVDAAPYFRIFSPIRQGERFDSEGAYVRRWLPELAHVPDRWVHQPWVGAEAGRRDRAWDAADYAPRVVDFDLTRREALTAHRELRAGGR